MSRYYLESFILIKFPELLTRKVTSSCFLNPIQDGSFSDCSRMKAGKTPLLKIRQTCTMIKPGTVIPYLKKIQKIYESRDTSPEFC